MGEMIASLINGAWKKKKKMKEKINGVWLSQMKKKNLTPTLHNTQKLIPNALQN